MRWTLVMLGAAALLRPTLGTATEPEPNAPPIAVVASEFVKGPAPLVVCFDASKSRDPEGGPITFRWSFGEGGPTVATAKACHEYGRPGLYAASVTVTDAAGLTGSASVVVSVELRTPAKPGA